MRKRVAMRPIPIAVATEIGHSYGYDQVVVIARRVGDDGGEHVTTAGINETHCQVAAMMGNSLKRVMQWPEAECNAVSQSADSEQSGSLEQRARDTAQASRNLAQTIRKYGLCAPAALDEVARRIDEIADALSAQPRGVECAHDWRGDGLCDRCGATYTQPGEVRGVEGKLRGLLDRIRPGVEVAPWVYAEIFAMFDATTPQDAAVVKPDTTIVTTNPPFQCDFIASGVVVEKGTESRVWLYLDPEGGGWYQWGRTEDGAKRFKTAKAAMGAARSAPGPWYNMPLKESIEALPVESKMAATYREMVELGQKAVKPNG